MDIRKMRRRDKSAISDRGYAAADRHRERSEAIQRVARVAADRWLRFARHDGEGGLGSTDIRRMRRRDQAAIGDRGYGAAHRHRERSEAIQRVARVAADGWLRFARHDGEGGLGSTDIRRMRRRDQAAIGDRGYGAAHRHRERSEAIQRVARVAADGSLRLARHDGEGSMEL
jgi:hypothetical protein